MRESVRRIIAAPCHPNLGHASDASVDAVDSRALKGKRGLQRLLNATRYSLDGLRAAWEHEDAFRQEVVTRGGADSRCGLVCRSASSRRSC